MSDGHPILRLCCEAPEKQLDSLTAEDRGPFCIYLLPPTPFDPRWLLEALADIEGHERREWLRVDGERIFNPHSAGEPRNNALNVADWQAAHSELSSLITALRAGVTQPDMRAALHAWARGRDFNLGNLSDETKTMIRTLERAERTIEQGSVHTSVPLAKDDEWEEVCECGDWKHQHKDGEGKCILCSDRALIGPCNYFRFFGWERHEGGPCASVEMVR